MGVSDRDEWTVETPRPGSSLLGMTDEIRGQLEKCRAQLNELTDRLEPILRPSRPEPTEPRTAQVEKMRIDSPLAETLGMMMQLIHILQARVDDLLERVQL